MSASLAAQNPLYKSINSEESQLLKQKLVYETNDMLKMVMLKNLSYYYQVINQDTAHHYAKQELKIAEKLNFEIWQAQALWFIGYSGAYMGNTPEAYQAFKRAITILQDTHCEQNIWGLEHLTNTHNPKYARLSLLANTIHDDNGIYLKSNKRPLNFKSALKIAKEISDTTTISIAMMNLGGFYALDKSRLDSSIFYSNKALFYARRANLQHYLDIIYYNLAVAYQSKKDTDTAIFYLRKALNTRGTKNSYTNSWANHMMADILRDRNQIDSSLFYAHQALEQAKLGNALVETLISYRYLADLYHKKGSLTSAFEFSQKARVLSDSLRKYRINKLETYLNDSFNEQLRLREQETERIQTINKLKTSGFTVGILFFVAFGIIQFRNRKKIEKTNRLLEQQRVEIESQKLQVEKALSELRVSQVQLIQKEKLASLGELTAGIAHEIQNPLNFVNNFSELSVELAKELKEERFKAKEERDEELENELLDDLIQNQEKINLHGKRASSIVKGMLEHSRTSGGERQLTDINQLADEYLRLSYHGLRAKDSRFNSDYELITDEKLPEIEAVPQEMGRVFLNLINNAFYAVNERAKQGEPNYQPKVTVLINALPQRGGLDGPPRGGVEIRIKDNGTGIPENIKSKIFQPFFTTKPTGEGTGLGLSLAYDIVTKGHGGTLEVENAEKEGTIFIIKLPIQK